APPPGSDWLFLLHFFVSSSSSRCRSIFSQIICLVTNCHHVKNIFSLKVTYCSFKTYSGPSVFQFFRTKVKGSDDNTYAPLSRPTGDTYEPLMTDPERGRNRRAPDDSTYTGLQKRSEPTYKELPVKRERQRKNEQVYQVSTDRTGPTRPTLALIS
uniref:Uncharacterized protein n=1 Tax=Poecilia latipinna TaxID=48699 RepID=A0A3B3VSB6_9TELE